jgi:hypothetical protein
LNAVFSFDGENKVSVIITRAANYLIAAKAHEIRPIVEGGRGRQEDEREYHDADDVVLEGTTFKRPE